MVIVHLLLALVLSRPVGAAQTFCLVGFAALSEGEIDPISLVGQTYGELLDSLGKELTPANLNAIAENERPFHIPEYADRDLVALRRHLVDFEALVRRKGWYTAELRDSLFWQLRARAEGRATAEAEVAKNIGKTEMEVLRLPIGGTVVQSPDGRYLIYHHTQGGHELAYVYDRRTKQRTSIPVEARQASFSPDSSEIRFPRKNGTFDIYTFRSGKVGADVRSVGLKNTNWPHAHANRATAGEFVAGTVPAHRHGRTGLGRHPDPKGRMGKMGLQSFPEKYSLGDGRKRDVLYAG